MPSQPPSDAHPTRLRRIAGRVLVIAALATGVWLLGQGAASAEEDGSPGALPETLATVVDHAGAPVTEPLATSTSAVAPAASRVAPVVEPAPAVAAPVTSAVVTPVASVAAPVVQAAAAPVALVPAPVLEAAESIAVAPVRTLAAPVLTTVTPVLHAVRPVVETVASDVAGTVDPVPTVGLERSRAVPPYAAEDGVESAVGDAPHVTGAALGRLTVARPVGVDGVAGPAGGGADVPPASPTSLPLPTAPAPAGGTERNTTSQPSADLPTWSFPATAAALVATSAPASDAVVGIAFDPSFSPD